ncbi:hypothetical protein ACS0TY_027552 [Phlomoides rotata]
MFALTYNMIFNYKLSSCYFPEQQVQNFGDPFFLVIHEGETLAEVKVRIQKKLQVPDEEFSKVCSTTFLFYNLNTFVSLLPFPQGCFGK